MGLRPTYWLKVFEKLEIDSVAALEFIEEDSNEYLELLKSVRKQWEIKALKRLREIGDKKTKKVEDTAEKKQKEEKEKIKEHQKELDEAIKKIERIS